MKLVASMIVRNEMGRYLEPCIEHLRQFCDLIVVLDDNSDDGGYEYLAGLGKNVVVSRSKEAPMFENEGAARQRLFENTLKESPDYILAIDADEFIEDGQRLRSMLEQDNEVEYWTTYMEEVWKADDHWLWTREDGGWHAHPIPNLYRAPRVPDRLWSIRQQNLACGREPQMVRRMAGMARPVGTSILHFGWARESERQSRYDRYAKHDGGQFHASQHLESILWSEDRIQLSARGWPVSLDAEAILSATKLPSTVAA